MKTVPLIALLTVAGALAGAGQTPAQAASRPSVAYFSVELYATQSGGWRSTLVSHTRECGVSQTDGHGTSKFRLHSSAPQVVTARRVASPQQVSLIVGRNGGAVPVNGVVERYGEQEGREIVPAASNGCPRPEPIARDCGTRDYPSGTGIGLQYETPASWDDNNGQTPLVPSLRLSGPIPPTAQAWVPYLNCPGERDDALLGLHTDGLGMDTGAEPLSVRTLFGKRKRFSVKGGFARTLHRPARAPLTGGADVTVAVGWRVKFTRLAHRPAGVR